MNLMKSLKQKKASIDFSNQDVTPQDVTPLNPEDKKDIPAYSPVALVKNANQQRNEIFKENEALKEKLRDWGDAKKTILIDPNLVKQSKWANRHQESFKNDDFKKLVAEIASANGNIQPIKVRQISSNPSAYEIIFGHRRHQACLELGIPVLAMIDELDDHNLFIEMDRENRQRADLSPYEQGAMYKRALDEGLFSSIRKLAESIGVDSSNVSKSLKLVNLPESILRAFASRLEIQYRWGVLLEAALIANSDVVLDIARTLHNELMNGSKVTAAESFNRLISHAPKPDSNQRVVSFGFQTLRILESDKGVTYEVKGISKSKIASIEQAIADILRD